MFKRYLIVIILHPSGIYLTYPAHTVPKFKRNHRSAFDTTSKTREFFDWLSIKLGHVSLSDWYSVSSKDICFHGGRSILSSHGDSPSRALEAAYPTHNWTFWRFENVPKGMWHNKHNQK